MLFAVSAERHVRRVRMRPPLVDVGLSMGVPQGMRRNLQLASVTMCVIDWCQGGFKDCRTNGWWVFLPLSSKANGSPSHSPDSRHISGHHINSNVIKSMLIFNGFSLPITSNGCTFARQGYRTLPIRTIYSLTLPTRAHLFRIEIKIIS